MEASLSGMYALIARCLVEASLSGTLALGSLAPHEAGPAAVTSWLGVGSGQDKGWVLESELQLGPGQGKVLESELELGPGQRKVLELEL